MCDITKKKDTLFENQTALVMLYICDASEAAPITKKSPSVSKLRQLFVVYARLEATVKNKQRRKSKYKY